MGLADHMAKYPEQPSGGWQQRVSGDCVVIGRAASSARLADEPIGNLMKPPRTRGVD
jgi:predicted ABC-type transport system involved in lysophospholipase L1 biosynthesis ATPase subunit